MPDLTITDFSGGMTDDYIDADPSKAQKADNVLINRYRKLVQRPAIDLYSTSAPQIPPGNQRIDALHYFSNTLFAKSGTKLYYLADGASSWTTLSGPTGNDAFPDSALGAKAVFSEWRGHLIITPGPVGAAPSGSKTMKVYRNASGVWTLVQAGLPRPEDGGLYTASGGTQTSGHTVRSYLYNLCFVRTYIAQVDGVNVTFTDRSKPLQFQVTNNQIGTDTYTVSVIGYTNGAGENYDTANWKTEIYRTVGDGTIPLFVAAVAMSGLYVDNTPDANLGAQIYTAGGALWRDPVPYAYFQTICDGYGWYGACYDIYGQTFCSTRLMQGVPGVPDAIYTGNYVDIVGTMTGLSYAGPNPIVCTASKTYRIDGRIDSFGGGSLRAVLISDVEGCLANKGMIRTDNGVFFPSANGFCFTDGYTVINLSKRDLRLTYPSLKNKQNLVGCYDPVNLRVLWGTENPNLSSISGNNNSMMISDLNYASIVLGEESGSFTTVSGQAVQPCSMHYDVYNGRILIGDQRGYVFVLNSSLTCDWTVDTSKAPSLWDRSAIVHNWISSAWSFGSVTATKWVTKLYAVAKNLTGSLSLDFWGHNDDKAQTFQLKGARERISTSAGMHKIRRWFASGGLRCVYKQVEIKKGYTILARSDDYALATMDPVGKTALLAAGNWPMDGSYTLLGAYLYTAADGYTTGYQISVQSGNTLTVLDPGSTFPSGSMKWEVKGYPKSETFELHGLNVTYSDGGETYTGYQAGGDDANA